MLIHGSIRLATALTVALALSACTKPASTHDQAAPPAATTSTSNTSSAPALKAANSSLGAIAVDGAGRTVYTYKDDKQGTAKSECSGGCLAAWPTVPATAKLEGKGLSAKLGTTTASDGTRQLTLNGFPLYHFSGDSKSGDVNGQGVDGEWWVISPAGDKIKSKSGPKEPAGSSGGDSGYGY